MSSSVESLTSFALKDCRPWFRNETPRVGGFNPHHYGGDSRGFASVVSQVRVPECKNASCQGCSLGNENVEFLCGMSPGEAFALYSEVYANVEDAKRPRLHDEAGWDLLPGAPAPNIPITAPTGCHRRHQGEDITFVRLAWALQIFILGS